MQSPRPELRRCFDQLEAEQANFLAALAWALEAGAIEFGAGPVLVRADNVDYGAESEVVSATGNVDITRGDRRLLADSVRYDIPAQSMEAIGNVTLLEPTGDTLFADRITLSGDLRAGVIEEHGGFAASLTGTPQGGIVSVRACRVPATACPAGTRRSLSAVRSGRVFGQNAVPLVVLLGVDLTLGETLPQRLLSRQFANPSCTVGSIPP